MHNASLKKKLMEIHEKVSKDTLTAAILGTFISIVLFLVSGGVFYFVLAMSEIVLSGMAFWLLYTSVFFVMVIIGMYYHPKERYDIEWNPFSYRDDQDRSHITLGFLLFIPNYVFGNLKLIWQYFSSKNVIVNFDLAAMIINNPRPDSNFDLNDLKIESYSNKTIMATISFLEAAELIHLDPKNSKKIMLTFNGKQLR